MTVVEADKVAARLLAELPHALDSGQLVAYFQPVVELSSGRITGAEALIRWEHPELGTLAPALFVPLADRLGLMARLTRMMLQLALAQHRAWADAGWAIPVAVNVGPESVADPGFTDAISEMLRSEQVAGPMLTLELSERTTTTTVGTSFFAQLAELGVRIALDDFGTGFASLESLGGWPIDDLKLDISLVRPIASNTSFRAIVRNTIDLAHQLRIRVIAEGVETDPVRSELLALGCDFAQGFLIGRPMPGEAFLDWVIRHEREAGRLGPGALRPGPGAEPGRRAAPPARRHKLALATWRLTGTIGPGTLAAVTASLVLYGLWQIFRWGGYTYQPLIGDLAFFPVNGMAAYCAWRVSRRADLGRAIRRAWLLLSVALWLYLAGDALQLIWEVVLHRPGYPTPGDAAYLSFYPIAFAGLMSFPSRYRTRPERTRLLLDVSTVFIGAATFIWYIGLGPALAADHSHLDLPSLTDYAYPVGDLLLLFGVLALLARGAPRSAVVPLRIFAAGVLMLIAADVCYDYITSHYTYRGGDPVDTLWMVGLALMWVAAAAQLRAKPQGELSATPADVVSPPGGLPYVAVAGSYLLLIIVGLHDVGFGLLGGIMIGALLLTVLVSARQFAALQDNSRLATRYQELASIDGLTGLVNRRHFIEVAEHLIAHAQRLRQPFTVLMIDADKFKQINDQCGHAMGDRVLSDLAQSCRENARADDLFGRYGGDEFAAILPDTTARQAAQLAGRLARSPGLVPGPDGAVVRYTISIGIAELAPGQDLSALLACADLAMYEAKRAGGGGYRTFHEQVAAGS